VFRPGGRAGGVTGTTLAVAEAMWAELQNWLQEPDEVAGVMTVRVIDDADGITLLARRLERAPASAYLDRRRDGLSLRSSGWVPAVRQAGGDASMAIFVHTHPGGRAEFSASDDQVDVDLWQPFVALSGAALYGSLVMAGGDGAPAAGRVKRPDGSVRPIDAIRVVGERLTVHLLGGPDAAFSEVHDRQLRAFGARGQQVLGSLRVGIVGAGGTGSPVAEQLIRLGVASLVVIDDDVVTASTVARGYGSGLADVGRPKVDVIVDLAARSGLEVKVTAVQGNIRDHSIVNQLRHCDVVFCCADGHAARLVLNRWAYWHLAPVIDIAILVSSAEGTITGIDGRLTWLAPHAACLLCRARIDPVAAYAEQLDPEDRRRLSEQGYVPELEEPQPSIVPYTTMMSAMATTELLNRLFGLADTTPSETLVQFHTRTTSLNRRPPREGCFCATPSVWGQGLAHPYLDLTWTD